MERVPPGKPSGPAPPAAGVIVRLENLVRKVKLQVQAAEDVAFHIHPPKGPGMAYVIEVSVGRYSRRIPVDPASLPRIDIGQGDQFLMSELRRAILAVSRLSRKR